MNCCFDMSFLNNLNDTYELLNKLDDVIINSVNNNLVKKVNLKLEKLDIIKNAESVGIEVSKIKDE